MPPSGSVFKFSGDFGFDASGGKIGKQPDKDRMFLYASITIDQGCALLIALSKGPYQGLFCFQIRFSILLLHHPNIRLLQHPFFLRKQGGGKHTRLLSVSAGQAGVVREH
jgi:hypothetical protein